MIKKLNYSFVSKLGRHNTKSFGYDLGIKNLKPKGSSTSKDYFKKSSQTLRNIDDVMTTIKIIDNVRSVVTGLLSNGNSSVANNEMDNIPYTSSTQISELGREISTYQKTRIHLGRNSSNRIKSIQNSAFIQTIHRELSSSMDDYQSHKRRQQLVFRSGFNERGFRFLSENSQMTVSKYYKLFELEKKQHILKQQIDGQKQLYGCILNTINSIKLKNRSDLYTANVRIHLIKIFDLHSDLRSLLLETTNNSLVSHFEQSGKIPLNFQYSDPEILDIDNKFSIGFTGSLTCNLNLSTRFSERAKILRSWNGTLPPGSIWDFKCTHHLGHGINLNRIFDLHTNVISIPLDPKNPRSPKHTNRKFIVNPINYLEHLIDTIDMDPALKAGLKRAIRIYRNRKNTQQKPPTIEPGMEPGVKQPGVEQPEVEPIVDDFEPQPPMQAPEKDETRNNHPVSYVFAIEFVGDRRSTVVNKKNYDRFTGYSPVQLSCEFGHEIKYLSSDDNEDIPITYQINKSNKNFNEESYELKDQFYPEREPKFHIPFDSISFRSGTMLTKGETDTKDKLYFMENDPCLARTVDNSMINGLDEILQTVGLDKNSATVDDLSFNYDKSPTNTEETEL